MPKRVRKTGHNTRKRTSGKAQETPLYGDDPRFSTNTQGQENQSASVTRPGGRKKKSFGAKILRYTIAGTTGMGLAAGAASTTDAATIIKSLF